VRGGRRSTSPVRRGSSGHAETARSDRRGRTIAVGPAAEGEIDTPWADPHKEQKLLASQRARSRGGRPEGRIADVSRAGSRGWHNGRTSFGSGSGDNARRLSRKPVAGSSRSAATLQRGERPGLQLGISSRGPRTARAEPDQAFAGARAPRSSRPRRAQLLPESPRRS